MKQKRIKRFICETDKAKNKYTAQGKTPIVLEAISKIGIK